MQQTLTTKFPKTLYCAVVILGLGVFTAPAFASNLSGAILSAGFPSGFDQLQQQLVQLPSCNSQSELLVSKGDDYYALPPLKRYKKQTNIKNADARQFNQLLKDIEGNWDGKALESVCFQTGHARLHAFEVEELDISANGSGRRYVSDHHDLARITLDRVRIASSDKQASAGGIRNIKTFTVPGISNLQEIEKLADNQFRISRLYRETTTSSGNSVLREREDWIEKTKGKLAWRTDWYTNGHYSGSELNVLKRRR